MERLKFMTTWSRMEPGLAIIRVLLTLFVLVSAGHAGTSETKFPAPPLQACQRLGNSKLLAISERGALGVLDTRTLTWTLRPDEIPAVGDHLPKRYRVSRAGDGLALIDDHLSPILLYKLPELPPPLRLNVARPIPGGGEYGVIDFAFAKSGLIVATVAMEVSYNTSPPNGSYWLEQWSLEDGTMISARPSDYLCDSLAYDAATDTVLLNVDEVAFYLLDGKTAAFRSSLIPRGTGNWFNRVEFDGTGKFLAGPRPVCLHDLRTETESLCLTPPGSRSSLGTETIEIRGRDYYQEEQGPSQVGVQPTPYKSVLFGFDRTGERVVTVDTDMKVRIWNASTGALQVTLAGHHEQLRRFETSDDGKYLAGVDGSGRLTCWELASGTLVRDWQPNKRKAVGLGFLNCSADLFVVYEDGRVFITDDWRSDPVSRSTPSVMPFPSTAPSPSRQ